MRREEEASQKREKEELDKRLEAARKKLEEEKQGRHRQVLEADRIRDQAIAKKSKAEREVQAKGHFQYKACFGKCNHPDCRKNKKEHFGSTIIATTLGFCQLLLSQLRRSWPRLKLRLMLPGTIPCSWQLRQRPRWKRRHSRQKR